VGRKKVLVIEDNALNMKLVRVLLGLGDYQVLEARDAEKGLALAREHRPDLILMDVQLPGMDGLSATRVLKEDPLLRDTAVVAMTAHAMPGDDEKARQAGCSGYIPKPIDTRAFLRDIVHYFP
jgi:CheY-like chemotaxis protein